MLHVFYGKDSFTLREKLDELRASLDTDGGLASSTSVLEGRRLTLPELTNACDTVPFLSSCRLVIVEGLLARVGGGGGRRGAGKTPDAEEWLSLAEYVPNMPETTHLVLVDEGFEGGGPLLEALKGRGEHHEFRPPGQKMLPGWISRRAGSLGLKLQPGAVRLLADFVGSDLWTLSGELEKLSLYAQGAVVSEDDVRALVAAVRQATVFPLVDAIVEGRSAVAIRLLRGMFRQEAGPQYIVSMIQRQLRHIAVAREMLDAGESGRAIQSALRLPDFAFERLLDQARRYPANRVRAAFERLLETDLSIKRGVYEGELALELFVHEMSAAGTRAA